MDLDTAGDFFGVLRDFRSACERVHIGGGGNRSASAPGEGCARGTDVVRLDIIFRPITERIQSTTQIDGGRGGEVETFNRPLRRVAGLFPGVAGAAEIFAVAGGGCDGGA